MWRRGDDGQAGGGASGRKPLQFGNELTKEVNRKQLEDLRPKMEDVEVRLADMDTMGVDVQALSLSPYQLFHWADGELGIRAFQTINDDLAELAAGHPDRFVGLGAIPLQEPAAAVTELRRCSDDLGFRGIEMATNIEGEEISSPRLDPFWGAVEELGMVVFIHPTGFTDPAVSPTTTSSTRSDTRSRRRSGRAPHLRRGDGAHPGLKFVVAHGGGYLPAYAGRFDHAYHAREDV